MDACGGLAGSALHAVKIFKPIAWFDKTDLTP